MSIQHQYQTRMAGETGLVHPFTSHLGPVVKTQMGIWCTWLWEQVFICKCAYWSASFSLFTLGERKKCSPRLHLQYLIKLWNITTFKRTGFNKLNFQHHYSSLQCHMISQKSLEIIFWVGAQLILSIIFGDQILIMEMHYLMYIMLKWTA